MHKSTVKLLICPKTYKNLQCKIFSTFADSDRIKDGVLYTSTSWYPIIDGIPRFVNLQIYQNRNFLKKYSLELKKLGLNIIYQYDGDQNIEKRQMKETAKKFGFEWFKWNSMFDDFYTLERCEHNFWNKTLLDKKELKNMFVLDAGCGNGKYAYFARKLAKKMICVDISSRVVESAFKNLNQYKNVDVIQADLANLPFPLETFDTIFSIGVLMHTGDTEHVFKRLTRHLKNKGVASVHIYAKRNKVFNFIDNYIRPKFAKMNNRNAVYFSRWFASVAKILEHLRILKYMQAFIHLVPNDLVMYDYWFVPVANRHTYEEMEKWCRDAGFLMISNDCREKTNGIKSKLARKIFPPYAITIKIAHKN